MTRDDIIRMAREAHKALVTQDYPGHMGQLDPWTMRLLERFAALVVAAERERIIAENAPEIERCNAYIKELEESMPSKILRVLEAAVKAEREACAALLEENAMACENPIYRSLLQANAQAIREMGKPNQMTKTEKVDGR